MARPESGNRVKHGHFCVESTNVQGDLAEPIHKCLQGFSLFLPDVHQHNKCHAVRLVGRKLSPEFGY